MYKNLLSTSSSFQPSSPLFLLLISVVFLGVLYCLFKTQLEIMEVKEAHETPSTVDKHNVSSSLSCQNIKQDTYDFISCLPDDLLHHVLSFLTMKNVIKTSILSRRWRYLWTTAPCLDFSESCDSVEVDQVTFIDKSIARHMGTKLRKFNIMFEYKDTDSPQIDSWIQFAVRRNVEEMDLDFLDGCSSDHLYESDPKYELPHYLFQCESLKDLYIAGSHFNLPTSMCLRSLKNLSLSNIIIPPDAIEHLTSSCPYLKHLILLSCNEITDLNIYDPNGRLQTLRIYEFESTDSDTNIVIHAPNLCFLEFGSCLPRGSYLVKKLSSFMNASFLIDSIFMEHYNARLCDAIDGYDMALLLHGLHVKNLKLCCWCIQVLSLWELGRKEEHLFISAASIQLETGFTKWELPGIAYVLMNSSNLETLKINVCGVQKIKIGYDIKKQYNFVEVGYWKSQELVFSTLPHKIKRVTIYGFPHDSSNAKNPNAILLVRFLLKNLKVLERITIFTVKQRGSEVRDGDNSDLRNVLTHGFSAASPNVELLVF